MLFLIFISLLFVKADGGMIIYNMGTCRHCCANWLLQDFRTTEHLQYIA